MIRLASALRLLAAVCLLLAVTAFFREPLRYAASHVVPGLSASFGVAAPASGFMLEMRASVPGARLLVDGVERGTSPFLGNIECRADDEVVLVVEAPGHSSWSRTVVCREGGRLVATPVLPRE
ncbi:MAG: hypothetical protein AAGC60_07870 [Acidobacteriota bacterium]